MNKYSNSTDNTSVKKQYDRAPRLNWNIKSCYCRVIEEGRPARIMPTGEAVEYAESRGMDLIEIGYDKQNQCSNCKVADYGKYIYEQKQREKAAKKQARANRVETKNLQISLGTDTADLNRIVTHAKEFLAEGNKVRIALRFRNRREMSNIDLAKKTLKSVIEQFDGIAVLDSAVEMNGRELSCTLRKA